MSKKYKVRIAESGKRDIQEKKKYIIRHFKYREYAENFSQKIKEAIERLEMFPKGYKTTGFHYRGYDIYLKPQSNHLIFYTVNDETDTVTVLRVLQDGMDWEYIIECWINRK